jgi:hypothetical protein
MSTGRKPRVSPLPLSKTSVDVQEAYTHHTSAYKSRITNMKATLGHSKESFVAYMEWYPLYEGVKKILGTRLSPLFAWSISEAADCPLCSTYFRKIIIESGESPEALALTKEEQEVLAFGAAIAQNKGDVKDELYNPIAARFSDKEIVILTAFAGIMIATNLFNNVLHTEIDDYLHLFKKPNES